MSLIMTDENATLSFFFSAMLLNIKDREMYHLFLEYLAPHS